MARDNERNGCDLTGRRRAACRHSWARPVIDVDLAEIVPYIDWTFFFAAWELKGRFPAILDHPQYGRAARELFDNARTLLDRIVAEKLIQARAVYGFWPANADGEDIVVLPIGRRRALGRGAGTPTVLSRCCVSRSRWPMTSRICRSRTSLRQSNRAHRLHRRVRRHRRAGRGHLARSASSSSTTTTTPSW